MENNNHGTETGELCNRADCLGVIEEHEKEGACSCHSNPPCSYCVDDNHYCPLCGWQGIDEQKKTYEISDEERARWAKNEQEHRRIRQERLDRFQGKLPIEKFECTVEGHTHFSQIVWGVYPKGMTREEVLEKVKGTFGGRFTMFDKGRFKYIAYTD